MATFVLIHGAFVGGWCWRWVTPPLIAAGHIVYTPTLTGHGERVHLATPQVGLNTHIEDIVNVLEAEDLTEVVLVGWSYGGMVVTGVADRLPERIAHVVYLDADIPRDGESSVPLSQHAELVALAQGEGNGWQVPLATTRVEALLLAELPEEQRRWVAARLTPPLLNCWFQPIRLTGAGAALRTTFVRCTVSYDATDEDTQRQDARIRDEPGWHIRSLDASHAAPLSAPQVTAALLLDLAGSSTA